MSESETPEDGVVSRPRLEAALRLLLDSGDLTPMGARILRML